MRAITTLILVLGAVSPSLVPQFVPTERVAGSQEKAAVIVQAPALIEFDRLAFGEDYIKLEESLRSAIGQPASVSAHSGIESAYVYPYDWLDDPAIDIVVLSP